MTESRKQNITEKLVEELGKTPFITDACKKCKISRASFYRLYSQDRVFREQVEVARAQSRDIVNDMAENKLVDLIEKGNLRAVLFWLNNSHPYYKKMSRKVRKPFVDSFDLDIEPINQHW